MTTRPFDFPHHLRFRQVHLDFHTSEAIPNVGSRFSKEQFQAALERGRVDSITLFSKCHHGWSYHPTEVGKPHPHLERDLLTEQIEACREVGVRCPIYLSAGVDELAAATHPEWQVKDRNGRTDAPDFEGNGFWFKLLRFDSPYLDYLCAQIEEVVRRWPDNDGIFLDIIAERHDYSHDSLLAMRTDGLDPANPADVSRHAQRVLLNYYRRTTASAQSARADTPVFHNGGHVPIGAHEFNFFNTHFELESLPTGGWGYDHFPLSARYAITQPRDFLGMTGKFHTTWGEFGGFKRPEALRYECASMLAQGAKCSVGDQLHPSGEMNPDTYALIGAAYADVEAAEPWCRDVRPTARIALVSTERNQRSARGHTGASLADEGTSRMLLELHQPFVILDEQADWDGFDVVVLPDGGQLGSAALAKAQAFLAAGGRIVAAGSALLDEAREKFLIEPGANLVGRSTFDPDYLVATDLSPKVPVRTPITVGGGAYELAATDGEILATRRNPYFNRTWEHYCSHQHAPDAPEDAGPAIVVGHSVAYFAHDIFSEYRRGGQPLLRDFFRAALERLLGDSLPVETNLPTVARFNLLEQPGHNRFIAHLLYAPITHRADITQHGKSSPIEIIEDLIPLHDIEVSLRLDRRVTAVRLVPGDETLEFESHEGRTRFTVPSFTAHQMIALESDAA